MINFPQANLTSGYPLQRPSLPYDPQQQQGYGELFSGGGVDSFQSTQQFGQMSPLAQSLQQRGSVYQPQQQPPQLQMVMQMFQMMMQMMMQMMLRFMQNRTAAPVNTPVNNTPVSTPVSAGSGISTGAAATAPRTQDQVDAYMNTVLDRSQVSDPSLRLAMVEFMEAGSGNYEPGSPQVFATQSRLDSLQNVVGFSDSEKQSLMIIKQLQFLDYVQDAREGRHPDTTGSTLTQPQIDTRRMALTSEFQRLQ